VDWGGSNFWFVLEDVYKLRTKIVFSHVGYVFLIAGLNRAGFV
jgi:hypothetical protein